MGEGDREDVAAFLGVSRGRGEQAGRATALRGRLDVAPSQGEYRGIQSCAAAVAVGGGGKGCAWGCVGYADCAVSCTFDAIR
jgi:Na+-translocating ferredoxin:NAD+ oxidoreductase subunit B